MNNTKRKILVVDDERLNINILGELLKSEYRVIVATSGEQALKRAVSDAPPDLILLDIMMPEMDGYEVCRRLKADKRTRDIPVIFVTAKGESDDEAKGMELGAMDYISKPIHPAVVKVRIKAHLSIQELTRELQDKNRTLSQTNEKLETALEKLKTARQELIHSEKMAALGQLAAGVAHEINSPLGAIRSSIKNVSRFFDENLMRLPALFQGLSSQRRQDFMALLERCFQQPAAELSSREKRQSKRMLLQQLETQQLEKAGLMAELLANMDIYADVEGFLPLLKDPGGLDSLTNINEMHGAQKSVQTIALASERAAKTLFALKSFARFDHGGKKVRANLIEGIETVLTLYHGQLRQGVEVVKQYADLPEIACYPDELNQVWTNLVHNALYAMAHKGTLQVDVTIQDAQVSASFTDSGKGIPAEIKDKIFQPFFTTKPIGEGSGLGLDIVKNIIDKHGGTITVESMPGKTTFTVCLPV
ncbi:MAG: response regulator [Gammaproteobacteria bacterium]|nr:response regulator [Gammaproteobacteria bacterium]